MNLNKLIIIILYNYNFSLKARPAQEYEIKELQAFASKKGLEGTLQHWDVSYWGRQQLRTVYE